MRGAEKFKGFHPLVTFILRSPLALFLSFLIGGVFWIPVLIGYGPCDTQTYTDQAFIFAVQFHLLGSIMSFVWFRFIFRRTKHRWQSKESHDVLRCFFKGFPRGSIMVSYCWSDGVDCPRRIASYFPCVWLDIENLIPGTPIQTACCDAARNALFRFVFLSSAYSRSPNCGVEMEQIRKEPGKAFFFLNKDSPSDLVDELRSEGHHLFSLSDIGGDSKLTAAWLLDAMTSRGVLRELFRHHSPAINEDWASTVGALAQKRWFTPLSVILPVVIWNMEAFVYDVAGILYGLEKVRTNRVQPGVLNAAGIIAAINLFGFLTNIFTGIYMLHYTLNRGALRFSYPWKRRLDPRGLIGATKREHPDTVMLLLFLKYLNIIDAVRVRVNDPGLAHDQLWAALVDVGVVVECDERDDADAARVQLNVLCLDGLSVAALAALLSPSLQPAPPLASHGDVAVDVGSGGGSGSGSGLLDGEGQDNCPLLPGSAAELSVLTPVDHHSAQADRQSVLRNRPSAAAPNRGRLSVQDDRHPANGQPQSSGGGGRLSLHGEGQGQRLSVVGDRLVEDANAAENIFWTHSGFASLPPDMQDIMKGSIVGTGVPSLEMLGCHLLMLALGCGMQQLTVGSESFMSLYD